MLISLVRMFFGAHVSAAEGLHNAPTNSAAIGGEVFQFFSRPPQGGNVAPLTPVTIRQFKEAMRQYGQKRCYIHAPYYINLASTNNRIRYGSISVLREELERGSQLGVKVMMTHLGSANDLLKSGMSQKKAGREGLKMVIEGIYKILDGYIGSCQFSIEISAGAGLVIGDTFDEIAAIIAGVESKKPGARGRQLAARLGVCFDTQHAFASGYDLREPPSSSLRATFSLQPRPRAKSVVGGGKQSRIGDGSLCLARSSARDNKAAGIDAVMKEFDKIVGLGRLVVIHCNDSLTELGSHKDRHADLGDGHIGIETFRALVQSKKLKNIDLILETPTDGKRERDINILKGFH